MNEKTLSSEVKKPIIFFDGVCVLCNRTIDYLISKDRKKLFKFAPLQGKTAQIVLGKKAKILKSIVLYQDGRVFEKSDAVIEILPRLGIFEYQVAEAMKKIPKKIRNIIYDVILKTRYQIFGKKNQCRLPASEEEDRFLE